MVVVQASKVSLPNPSLSSPHITSLLFEPTSLSLALMHSDSSFTLYSPLSPLRISSCLPPPQTVISAPSSSFAFVLLQNPNSPHPRPLFIVSGPHAGGSLILLRFYIFLQGKKRFTRARVVCNQKDLQFVERFGILVDSVHGVSVKLAGSVNFFAMYSVSSSKVWIFAAKLVDGEVVKLMRCAVIECSKPVFSITLSFGFLIIGEEMGVSVFNLRLLLKGKAKNAKASQPNSKLDGRNSDLPNGVIGADTHRDLKDYAHSGGSDRCGKCAFDEGASERTCDCNLDGKNHRHLVSVKQRPVRLRQDSFEAGACFLAFSSKDVEASNSRVMTSVKAISVQALSPEKFLILDSAGNLHLLCWSNPVTGSDMTPHIRQLPEVMHVQKLAVLADSSIRTQTVWLSDGYHSLHVVAASDIEGVVNENDKTENEEKLMQISVVQAIFASEKIEDVIPLAANAILILGQEHCALGGVCFIEAKAYSNFNLQIWYWNRGPVWMLVLEECVRQLYNPNPNQRTTSSFCRENRNFLAVGLPVFLHLACMFEILMLARWTDESAIQPKLIIRGIQDGVFKFNDAENFRDI